MVSHSNSSGRAQRHEAGVIDDQQGLTGPASHHTFMGTAMNLNLLMGIRGRNRTVIVTVADTKSGGARVLTLSQAII